MMKTRLWKCAKKNTKATGNYKKQKRNKQKKNQKGTVSTLGSEINMYSHKHLVLLDIFKAQKTEC